MDLRERILKISRDRFFKCGIRNVTTKDISEDLGISKKTLYSEFDSKDSIVTEITSTYFTDHANRCKELCDHASNAVEEMIIMMEYVFKTISRVNVSMIEDLKKYHPKGWEALQNHRVKHVEELIAANLERGKEEGWYRKEINNNVFKKLRTIYMDVIPDEKYFSTEEFDIREVHKELMVHYFYGISTEKGHALFDQYLNQKK